MGEHKSSSNNRWNWEVSGFEPRRTSPSSPEDLPRATVAPLMRRYSISAASSLASPFSLDFSKQALASKVLRLKDKVKLAKEDYLELRQEANDLQEYSNAKLDRVTRYLGVLADKTRKLDQFALESEARISPLVNEKKRLFNDLLTAKGNIKLFCRTRPLFEDEGPSIVEFPDECTIRINTGDDTIANPKKDFEFDRVYGPHVGQAELFSDVQPFVQSALDGYNISIFAYGQTRSGKTHTMEGSNHDRGLYARCFEELFDLANSDLTSTSKFNFSVTAFDLYNEQIRDLLSESGSTLPKICLELPESSVELVQDKVDNPMDFSKVLKVAFQSRESDTSKFNVSHLIIMVHIYYSNVISGENSYSKLSLIDLAGSDGQILEEDSGERVTDLLHVMKSLSALGDVLSSLTSKKDNIPYENSMLTNILADSLGMEGEEEKKLKEAKYKIFQIYKDFLTGVAKLDELVPVGGKLLTGFQQGLECLRRPPIKKTSKLIENILKANGTKRLKSYLEAGCINSHDRVENTSKLHTCLHGLHDHLIKVKSILNELECLLGVAIAALQMANEHLSPLMDMESVVGLDPQESSGEDEMTSSRLREPEVTYYAAVMGIIYSMVKQDYTMQNKILTSLNLKSSSEELESYSLMWSLRPYVNDQTMKLAWKLVP